MASKKRPARKAAKKALRAAAAPAPAGNPLAEVRCDGLALAVGAPGQEALAEALVEQVVQRNLSGNWKIHRVNPEARDFELIPTPRISVARAFDLVAKLQEDRDVEWAEPILDTPGVEPEPMVAARLGMMPPPKAKAMALGAAPAHQACSTSTDWSLDECKVKQAWQHPLPSHGSGRRQGEGIIVGHPDTGYTLHPEINDPQRLLTTKGFDFLSNDPDPKDSLSGSSPGHGTATASVIMSGVGGPGAAAPPHVTGTAPLARLVPLRVSESVIHFKFGTVTHAVEFAARNGHHVVSMSLGGPFKSQELLNAIRRALDKGIVLIAAAGNQWPFVVYPARFDEVIAVAASNCRHAKWDGSASGADVDVTAPGESVWRANGKTQTVERSSGTSYATATTAGICALWLAYHGRDRLIAKYGARNVANVFKEILMKTANVPPNWDKKNMGAGIVDALAVLKAELPTSVAAGGMKALRAARAAAPRPQTDFDDLMHFFPDQPRPKIRKNLAALLGVSDEELDDALRRHGAELKLHAAIDPAMRQSIIRGRVAAKAGAKALAAAPRPAGLSLSNGLRKKMGV
jgi:serine protease